MWSIMASFMLYVVDKYMYARDLYMENANFQLVGAYQAYRQKRFLTRNPMVYETLNFSDKVMTTL